ncbi:MAG: ferrochelatase [Deltaproteobacteria bacterium]|nr:ferrochelatase [Deltaproteobacteria bacterium]
MAMARDTAVVLLNMGAPERPEEDAVRAFLYELFADPYIIQLPLGRLYQKSLARVIAKKRAPLMLPHYKEIGGSPLLPQTIAQAAALEKLVDMPVHVAMRYSPPRAHELMSTLRAAGTKRVILLPMYPQYSRTTSTSSVVELADLCRREGIAVTAIDSYPDRDKYIDTLAARWHETTDGKTFDPAKTHVLFTAHGVPVIYVKRGDPYIDQVGRTMAKIREKLPPELNVSIAYQSRLGPVEWMKPYLDKEVVRLGNEGIKTLVMFPITFVSEHLETLYELDVQVAEMAHEAGVEEVLRVRTAMDHPIFIGLLADLVREGLARSEAGDA